MRRSFLVLGDQLSREVAPWSELDPDTTIVLIENGALISRSGHLTRTALYLSSMRRFAQECRDLGYRVDYRRAGSFREGLDAHRLEFQPEGIFMNSPHGRRAQALFRRLNVEQLPNPFFLTSPDDFRRGRYKTMETFYRDQRRRLNVLMDGDQPVGGKWNFDELNREPLPKDGGEWPNPWSWSLSSDETDLVDELTADNRGGNALQFWPRSREQALHQLADAVQRIIPRFGPHEDAASTANWHLAHSRLSVALNMGFIHPREVVIAVCEAYERGHIPVASCEGFIRQVIGWREWVYVLHQIRDASYGESNFLSANNDVPRSWTHMEFHPMACLDTALRHLHDYGWTHHIERLMIMTNAATVAGLRPSDVADFMATTFVDGAEWVMEANVVGMGTFADGGQTATKPYIAGGNYISKMTNCCRSCDFSPTARTGDEACPLTTLYWDFLIRHHDTLAGNHRIAPQRRAAAQRPDRDDIQLRAHVALRIVRGDRDA